MPGIAFAEWGPGDMGMSLGFADAHDPPYPPEMQAARARVLAACKANGLAFLEQVTPENVVEQIDEGVMIGAGSSRGSGRGPIGRRHTNRPEALVSDPQSAGVGVPRRAASLARTRRHRPRAPPAVPRVLGAAAVLRQLVALLGALDRQIAGVPASSIAEIAKR